MRLSFWKLNISHWYTNKPVFGFLRQLSTWYCSRLLLSAMPGRRCCWAPTVLHTHTFKTNLDFSEARGSEWQWHQLGHMQVCTSLQTDNHTSTPPLCFLQAGCPSCRPTSSVKALKDRAAIDRYSARPEHSRRGVWWANDVTDGRTQWCIAKNGGGSDRYIGLIIIIAMTMFMVLSSWPESLREFTRFIWWM